MSIAAILAFASWFYVGVYGEINMSLRCAMLFAIYFFGLIISLDALPRPIENLKTKLGSYYFQNCFEKTDLQNWPPRGYNLHPNYLNAVFAARALLVAGKFDDGRQALVSATKAMVIDRPDLTEYKQLPLVELLFEVPGPRCLQNLEEIVESFVNDVAEEKKKRKFR
ncbi:uncharacterized protein LOC126845813 [Adelges cooleyi]|uniref:uncharacterized protein LOC126845813 n=1 Tax=Adelges cooleyi TaxID=133065 RepID=UPI00218060C3|nr:uncharacterized protein LOC126845813 [Adelges cooleyi]